MKLTYELKNMSVSLANAYFATVKNDDMTTVIDLCTGTVTTKGALAMKHPRSEEAGPESYLVMYRMDMEKARRWWKDLQRVDCGEVTYAILDSKSLPVDNDFDAIGLSEDDHRLYRISWDAEHHSVAASRYPMGASLKPEQEPGFGWNMKLGEEERKREEKG